MGGRRKWTAGILAIVLITLVGVAVGTWQRSEHSETTDGDSTWVMGYYMGYLKDRYPLDAVQWAALTHVVVGAVVPRPDGSLDTSFFLGDRGPQWAGAVVDRTHAEGKRAVLMVGGAHTREAFRTAASDSRRPGLVREILTTVDRHGFDGVDIDWEPMKAEDGPSILALGQDLRRERPSLVLTAPVEPVNVNDPDGTVHHLLPGMASVFDRLNMMTYGMNGGWSGWTSWHSGALTGAGPRTPMSVEGSFEAYVRSGIPPAKLGLGIGFFGSCMRGVTGPGQSSPSLAVVGDDNTMSYANIMTRYYSPGRARWDDHAQVPYLSARTPFGPESCTYVTYEDERSIAAKATFARRHGMGGAIIWNINQGYMPDASPGRRDALMDAVRTGFLEPPAHAESEG